MLQLKPKTVVQKIIMTVWFLSYVGFLITVTVSLITSVLNILSTHNETRLSVAAISIVLAVALVGHYGINFFFQSIYKIWGSRNK